MTDEEVLASLKTDNERAEFRCALNLHNFARLAVSTFYGMKNAEFNADTNLLATGVFASAYVANLRWLANILYEKAGRFVTAEEVSARWEKYYKRLVETGLRSALTYNNGISKTAPMSFDFFHPQIIKWRDAVRQLYAKQKTKEKEQ